MSNHHTPPAVIAAILDDYRAGRTIPAIAERHGVSERTVHRHTVKAGLREPRPNPGRPTRPARLCENCGKRCRREETMCRDCQNNLVGIELTDGQWVPADGIMRWQPDPAPVADGRAKCGTDGGYYSHLRHAKTKPCWECRVAHAAAERNRVARANGEAVAS